jgi:integrase
MGNHTFQSRSGHQIASGPCGPTALSPACRAAFFACVMPAMAQTHCRPCRLDRHAPLEILNLRWLDLDTANGRILLPQTKNGDGRIVYQSQSAAAAVQCLRKSPDAKSTERLFEGVTPEQVSLAFVRVCRKQQILDFRFHDSRHTAASWLRMQGADIHTVAQLLGHKHLRMAARYQHLSPAFLADAVATLDYAYGPLELAPINK